MDSLVNTRSKVPWYQALLKNLARGLGKVLFSLGTFSLVILALFAYTFVAVAVGVFLDKIGAIDSNGPTTRKDAFMFLAVWATVNLLGKGIYESQRPWLSVWYALLACVAYIVVSMLALIIYSTLAGMSWLTMNNAISDITAFIFLPAAIGACQPARRE